MLMGEFFSQPSHQIRVKSDKRFNIVNPYSFVIAVHCFEQTAAGEDG